MRKMLALFLFLPLLAFAQGQGASVIKDTFLFNVSGTTWNSIDPVGTLSNNFEYVVTGGPATVSGVVSGCMRGGTCDTLDTNTSTTSTVRKLNPGSATAVNAPYDYYQTVVSWTGGAGVTIRVNRTGVIGTASSGGGGGGAVTQSGVWTVGLSAGVNTIGKVDQGAAGASAWPVSGTVNSGASVPVSVTLQNAAVANANGTTLNTTGMSSAILTVNCSGCGGGTTVNFEATEDNTNYFPVSAVQLTTLPAPIAVSTTTAGLTYWQLQVANTVATRARVSGYSAGTVTVTGHTSPVGWNDNGSALSLNSGAADASTLRAILASGVNYTFNLAQVGGTNSVTGGLAGSQSVGGTAANDAAINQNPLLIGAETISQGSNPTASTSGNQRRVLSTKEGVQIVQEGSSNRFSCFKDAITALTECQAAPSAGLRAYVTGVFLSNEAATVQGVDIVMGTGTNCGTGTAALTHKFQMGTNATTTSPYVASASFPTPLVPTAATAICARPTAGTAFGVTIVGYIAP